MKKLLSVLICLITVCSILSSFILSIASKPPNSASVDSIEELPQWFFDANLTEKEYDEKNPHGGYYEWNHKAAQMLSDAEFVFPKSMDVLYSNEKKDTEDTESNVLKNFHIIFYVDYDYYIVSYYLDDINYHFYHYPYDDKSQSIESIYEGKNIVAENQLIDGIELDLWQQSHVTSINPHPTTTGYWGIFDTESSRIQVKINADIDKIDSFSLDWLKLDTVDNVIPEIQAWQEEKAKSEETTDREKDTDDKKSCAGMTLLSVHLLLITAIAAAIVIKKK